MSKQPDSPYNRMYQRANYFGYKEWLYGPYIAAVSAKAGLGPDSRVLDVGCGQGFFSKLLHRTSSNVLGIDLSATGISNARSMYQSQGLEWSSPKKVDMDRTDRSVSLGVFSAFGSVD
jgi:cyclopropane fatty-acyl-phospholipid synthase-like methyltransferase